MSGPRISLQLGRRRDSGVLVTRFSPVSQRNHARTLPVTLHELKRVGEGAPIEEVMPYLPLEDREWLLTGVMPHEQRELQRLASEKESE